MGNSLFDSSQDLSLSSINDGIPTYISYFTRSSSVIDLTFVSSDLIPYCSWNSFDDSFGSDHIPSVIMLYHPIQTRSFFSSTNFLFKINCKLLFITLSLSFPSLSVRLDSDISPIEKYIFYNFIKDTITSLLPERKSNINNFSDKDRKGKKSNNRAQPSSSTHLPAPWWNEHYSEAVESRNQALRAFCRNPSRSSYLNLKKTRSCY